MPVKEVFNWRRLVVRGITLAVLTLVLYLLVGAGFCLVNGLRAPGSASAGFTDFHEVATIWAERNLFMMNTIWPRKAYLVILAPENPDLRIGRTETPPALKVRALKYVVADGKTREGWRALTWADLKQKSAIIHGKAPAELPGVLATGPAADGFAGPAFVPPADALAAGDLDVIVAFTSAPPGRGVTAAGNVPGGACFRAPRPTA